MKRLGKILSNLEPKEVMYYFEEISGIPRGSKNEKEISDYLVEFAKKRELEVIQDNALNIIIKKEATKGYEHVPTVIIQGHMDMVCEKNQDTEHDFEKEGIKLQIKDGFITGTGTTLGADNGIAVAFALALLDSDEIPHPALEVLITADEEQGMTGASALDPSLLQGKIMLNIDTEEEGELYVSCAGGARGTTKVAIAKEAIDNSKTILYIKIRGLSGGHSGVDIHQQKGNSNKMLARFLNKLLSETEFKLVSISGGSKDNAIPREADTVIEINEKSIEIVEKLIDKYNKIYRNEFYKSDAGVNISYEKVTKIKETQVMDFDSTKKVVNSLFLHPNGIKRMSNDIEGLVETSLNVGVVSTQDNYVQFNSALRSSVTSAKLLIVEELQALAAGLGNEFEDSAHYPAWQYKADSKIREIMTDVYERINNKKPLIKAIHAGLECGIFDDKFSNMDMISIGPDIFGAHTPEERVSIESTKRVWEYFIEVLAEMKHRY